MVKYRLNYADVAGQDGEASLFCNKSPLALNGVPLVDLCKRCGRPPQSCPQPPPNDLTELLSTWFAKPKPANAVAPPPSGKQNLRVVHLSDL